MGGAEQHFPPRPHGHDRAGLCRNPRPRTTGHGFSIVFGSERMGSGDETARLRRGRAGQRSADQSRVGRMVASVAITASASPPASRGLDAPPPSAAPARRRRRRRQTAAVQVRPHGGVVIDLWARQSESRPRTRRVSVSRRAPFGGAASIHKGQPPSAPGETICRRRSRRLRLRVRHSARPCRAARSKRRVARSRVRA